MLVDLPIVDIASSPPDNTPSGEASNVSTPSGESDNRQPNVDTPSLPLDKKPSGEAVSDQENKAPIDDLEDYQRCLKNQALFNEVKFHIIVFLCSRMHLFTVDM